MLTISISLRKELIKKKKLNFMSDELQREMEIPSCATASLGVTVYFREPEPVILLSVKFTNIMHKIDDFTDSIYKDSAQEAQVLSLLFPAFINQDTNYL